MTSAEDSASGGDDRQSSTSEGAYRAWLGGLVDLVQQVLRRTAAAARRTPGRLSMIATGLVALSLLACAVGTAMAQGKKDTVDGLLEHREPVAAAAQQLYRELSAADAEATSAYLATATELDGTPERYEGSVEQAGRALAAVAADMRELPAAAEPVYLISSELPTYTGLVETARASTTQDPEDGAAALREASDLMRGTLLPAARELQELEGERLLAEQREASSFPVVSTVLAVVLLGALLGTQVYLRRKTNRVLNRGLVAATVAVLIGMVWTTVALVVQSVHVHAGQRDGTEQVQALSEARIVALHGRAEETLNLVESGDGEGHGEEFMQLAVELAGTDGGGGMLAEVADNAPDGPVAAHVQAASEQVEDWLRASAEVRVLVDRGEHEAAVRHAIDVDGDGGAGPAFRTFDDSLRLATEEASRQFASSTTNGANALHGLPQGLAGLGVIAALGITVGVGERLREYR
ncbi:hypothetical protein [Haloechinothrix sp. LS1_15]|uniref:hypothetical protein n=1 Tax=Haloechinothrix sp. LS1_15 TaxID=2652248 RepID=UPI0029488858|nr:hypothetical protein [Haloechinothrix sp. LS1_15]MDV6012537.1 hypothetical protein [Haloechinothrix sp. LS1_15]